MSEPRHKQALTAALLFSFAGSFLLSPQPAAACEELGEASPPAQAADQELLAASDLFAAAPAEFRLEVEVRQGADAAVPGVAVHDTIRHADEGAIDRSHLVAVQTPQAFRASALRAAHAGGGEATDDASLVEAAGGTVVVVPGRSHNLKITDPGDLRIAAVLLDEADA